MQPLFRVSVVSVVLYCLSVIVVPSLGVFCHVYAHVLYPLPYYTTTMLVHALLPALAYYIHYPCTPLLCIQV